MTPLVQLNQETKDMLGAAGFSTIESTQPKRWADCVRIATKLQQSESKTIGFFPIHHQVPLMSSMALIGLALSRLRGQSVALLSQPENGPLSTPQSISDQLALYRQQGDYQPGASVDNASKHLKNLEANHDYVLANFSEFKSYGEHGQAASLCDGVVIVGERLKTTEGALRTYTSTFDARQLLGVLLVDRSDTPSL